MKAKNLLGYSAVISSIIASLCCVGPVFLVGLGIGSVGLFSQFEALRTYLIILSLLLLAVAFYLTYKKKEVACEDGSCRIESVGKWNKIIVLIAAIISLVIITFPLYKAQTIDSSINQTGVKINKFTNNNNMRIMNDTCTNSCEETLQVSNQDCCSQIPDKSELSDKENQTRQFIYNFIINHHRAPNITEIQKSLMFNTPDKVRDVLQQLCTRGFVDLDEDEIIAAFPFSPKPSNNTVTFEDGKWTYAMCAIDALGISQMMSKAVVIKSTTPLDKKQVRVVFKGEKMKSISPKNAVIWYSTDKGSFAKVRCREINFFANKNELQRWKEKYPSKKGITLSIDEALKSSQLQFGPYLNPKN